MDEVGEDAEGGDEGEDLEGAPEGEEYAGEHRRVGEGSVMGG